MHNPSFENGWTDVKAPSEANALWMNQQPTGWTLEWLMPGQNLWDSQDQAHGVPECVHKLASQLPPSQQPGGSDALILDGLAVYKIFNATASFGAQLSQTITGLAPNQPFELHVPVRLHRHNDPDPWAAEAGVWANGIGHWESDLTNQEWGMIGILGSADETGCVEVVIRVKSKWDRPKDFFIDAIQFVTGQEPDPDPDPERFIVSIHEITVWSDGSSDHIEKGWPAG